MATPQHDLGGTVVIDVLKTQDVPLQFWELQTHALLVCLAKRGHITTDELRRCVEALEPEVYSSWPYYAKWAAAMMSALVERGVISQQDITDELSAGISASTPLAVGDRVRVKSDGGVRWRKPHLRVPGYIFGLEGVVERCVGTFADPSFLAFRMTGPPQSLYRVAFKSVDVRASCYHLYGAAERTGDSVPMGTQQAAGSSDDGDTVVVDIYGSWLEPALSTSAAASIGVEVSAARFPALAAAESHSGHPDCRHPPHAHDHGAHDHGAHDHGHAHGDEGHVHEQRDAVEATALAREEAAASPASAVHGSPGEALSAALRSVLDRTGVVPLASLAAAVESLELAGARFAGAQLVARAWVDDDFRRLLLTDATAAAAAVGVDAANPNAPTVLVVVEDTPDVHNVVVCTLCSCYPSAVLGLSPAWYKSRAYRARCVREPRAVLAEFGTVLPASVAVRVHDSTADCRYMVLPLRPAGTEGWTEAELRALVTRDSLVGVTLIRPPEHA